MAWSSPPLQPKQTLAGADNVSITQGCANLLAEQYKRKKYHPLPVTPITFEAHGQIGLSALDFLHQLSKTLPTLREQTAAYHHAIQQLSTTLQRNNAQTINTHLATAATGTRNAAPAAVASTTTT